MMTSAPSKRPPCSSSKVSSCLLPSCSQTMPRCLPSQNRTLVVVLLTMLWTSPWMGVRVVEGRRFMERQTIYGRVRGLVETVEGGKRVEKYLGIPYARPPVGQLRFEAPQPPDPWRGVLRATELPPACPQPQMGVTYIDMHIPGFNRTSEDCLYLNIHSPKHGQNRRVKYPVVVFVHGGSYQNGMGAMLDGDMLATYDVIVVTFNYRLGALGFLSIPGSPLTGNYGMLDQVEALKWVKANIANFGGDPNRVTIDGHSAGGCSVGLLMLSPLSKGLFSSVIEQSGSPFAHWAVNRHQSSPAGLYVRMFVTAMGCASNLTTASHLKRCLQQLPSDVVQEIVLNEPEIPISLIPAFRPVVDGHFLPELPEVLAARGDVTGRNFLTGATLDEGLIAAIPLVKRYKLEGLEGTQKLLALMNCFRGDLPQVHGIVESILEAYAKWPYNMNDEEIKQHFSEIVGDYFILAPTHMAASVMATLNLTVFVYNYEYRSDFDQWEGVMHGSELFYLSGFPLKGHTNFRYDDSDKHMARLLLQLWANFARNGLPSLVPLKNFHMPRFTLGRRAYTRFFSWDRRPSWAVQHDLKPDKMTFWNRRVPLMFQRQLDELLKYPPAGTLVPRYTKDGEGRAGGAGTELIGPGAGAGADLARCKEDDAADSTGNGRPDSTMINTQLAGDEDCKGCRCSPRDTSYLMTQASGSWVLIAACIGLSLLTVLLSVCYCQVRRQVTNLIRQSSVSSGQPML